MNTKIADISYVPGNHVLLDFIDAQHMTDIVYIEQALREAANMCGATVLEVKLHSFGEGQGITGVALLAESHISIHTWPELGFIALDIFVCGHCDARLAIDPLKKFFQPQRVTIKEYKRGIYQEFSATREDKILTGERHNMS